MGDNHGTVTGGCMCGAVRYEAIGELLGVGHCHCASCRRHTGAPVVTFVPQFEFLFLYEPRGLGFGARASISATTSFRAEYENHVENIFGDEPRLPL